MLDALAKVLVTTLPGSSVKTKGTGRVEVLAPLLEQASGQAVVLGVQRDFLADLVTALQEVVLAMAAWAAAETSAWEQEQLQD